MRPLIALTTVLFLAACANAPLPSVEGGGCKLVEQPDRPICGLTRDDQEWIDITLARAGAACHWQQRPGETCVRPVITPKPPSKPKPKPHFWQRKPLAE